MKFAFFAAIAGAALASAAAQAADMPAKAPAKSVQIVPYNWTGFYAGLNFGYGVSTSDVSQLGVGDFGVLAGLETRSSTVPSTIASKGAFVGLQGGYNFQIGRVVLGVEGDWQLADQSGEACGFACGFTLSPDPLFGASGSRYFPLSQRVKWFSTARGRAGWTPFDGAMVYGTAGGAWMGVDVTNGVVLTAPFETPPIFASTAAGVSKTVSGYAVGGGAELQLWRNWTGKFEYLHIDVGGATSTALHSVPGFIGPLVLTTTTSRIKNDIIRLGVNYRLGPAGMGQAGMAMASASLSNAFASAQPGWNWSGFYVGANGGYGVATDSYSLISTNFVSPVVGFNSVDNTIAPKGAFMGLQSGYNYQTGPIVWGVEADWQWANQGANACTRFCATQAFAPPVGTQMVTSVLNQKIDWFATARGRVGWTPVNGAMLYATGGGAWMGVELTDVFATVPPPIAGGATTVNVASFSDTPSGWTAGAGAELRIWDKWTGKFEYLHMDVGSGIYSAIHTSPGFAPFQRTLKMNRIKNDIFRLGLNYKLGNHFVN